MSERLYTEDDYRAYVRFRKALERHTAYGKRIRRYIRENRDYLELTGWIEWAYEESRKKLEYVVPDWTDEQRLAMSTRYEANKQVKQS